jgi:DNA gyrase subunit A
LGGLVAEGTVKENEIEFCNSDPDWVKEFDARWQRVFPDCRLHRFTRKPNSFGKKPYETREIHSRFVIRFLRNVGLEPARSRQKTIPASVLRSTRPVAAAFLRAYFEGDGSIISSGKKMVELSCTSGSGQLIREIQTLLLRFGIASTKRFDRYREIHKLYIRGLDNYQLFEKEIGFCSERKQDKLREAVSSCHRDFSITDFVPHIGRCVREHLDPDLRWSGGKEFILKNNIDRYPKLEEHLPRAVAVLDRRTQPKALELFQDLLFTRYLFDPIVQVEKCGIERVYSLKVESTCHSFVANGFINHNTEARLAPIASTLLRDIDKETVDFGPNFDETLEEPKLLPAILPNLLVNGAGGIAVGMATNIPPHNLGEVSDAILSLVDDPNLTVKDLMKFVKGPDFPTGASIVGAAGIKSAYETGRGSLIIRSTATIEELKGGREAIVVTAIPYQVNKSTLIESMANLVNNKKIEGIADIRDESDRKGMRIVVVLKRDAASQVILNQLFKHTQLQTSFGVILLALADGRPRVLNLKEILEHYISHRKEVILRRSRFDLEKAKDRAHILEGLKVALDNLDQIIKTIRKAKTPPIAKEALMNNFDLSERQAQAILDRQRIQRSS